MIKKILSLLQISLVTLTLSVVPIQATNTETSTTTELTVIEEPTVVAETAIIMDADSGQVLFDKGAQEVRYPASITKLMTALLVLENLSPEDTLTFSETALNSITAGSSSIGMRVGETITVADALHGLLLMSANEVANGLAEKTSGSIEAFVTLMNKRAQELGTKNSNFMNPHGLPDENHYSSAYDMALITKEALTHEYFLEVMANSMYQIPATNQSDEIRYLSQQHKMLNNKNDMRIYRDDVIAGKIGYTQISNHTLVTVAKQGERTLIVVIMKDEGSMIYEDTAKLLDYGFSSFHPIQVSADEFSLTLPVYPSTESSDVVSEATSEAILTLQKDYTVYVRNDFQDTSYSISPDVPTTKVTSLNKGDSYGSATLSIQGQPNMNLALVVSELIQIESTESSSALTEQSDPPLQETKNSGPTWLLIPILLLISIGSYFAIPLWFKAQIRKLS